jgi:hypothetical protein
MSAEQGNCCGSVRPELRKFMDACEVVLKEKDAKWPEGWKEKDLSTALDSISDQMNTLYDLNNDIEDPEDAKVVNEVKRRLCHVANFAMMAFDNIMRDAPKAFGFDAVDE